MKRTLSTLSLLIIILFLESCSIFGVHFSVHNPKHEGKIPKFTSERILLGELTAYRTCFDVNYYDLSLDINPKEKSLNGIVEIHAKALEDFDTIQIDLHENFEITELIEVGSNLALNYERRERANR